MNLPSASSGILIRQLSNERRALRLVKDAIGRISLNLEGLTVLTEVATGPFVLTPMIAAAAGANVIAVARDSRFGTAADVMDYARGVAERFGIGERIRFTSSAVLSFVGEADVITNLGFVRPINRAFVSRLKSTAVVCLMWSPWEFRDLDIDRIACDEAGIPIIGTNEEHPYIQTSEYVGLLAVKLLLEKQIEIIGSRISLLASDPFGKFIRDALERLGSHVRHVDPTKYGADLQAVMIDACDNVDAVVLAEHRDNRTLIGPGGVSEEKLSLQGIEIIHISGAITLGSDPSSRIKKYPPNEVPFGVMTLTTDHLGPKSVIDLHTGGLKVGAIISRARQAGLSAQEAIKRAEASGYGAALQ